jgi:hypothetical protein
MQAAKCYPTASSRHIQRFVPPLVVAIKDINIRVKLASERAIFHIFDRGSEESLKAFELGAATAGNQELVKFIKDYVKNTLSRFALDSGDEADRY